MLTLGIETSCDETGVALIRGRRVLSNIVSSSVHLHKKYGGVVPEIASRFHVEYILEVLEKALRDAGEKLKDVKLVAVTNGPGLVGALLIGISLAKSLSYSLRVPIIGVNHVLAHLYSAFLNDRIEPRYPFVGLVVSGGHTALFYCEGAGRQKLLGQTLDDAVGEAYDKVAKILNLGYPGGPAIEKMARRSKHKNKIFFPKTYLEKDSLDFSFSGIKTAVLYYVNKIRNPKSETSHKPNYIFREVPQSEIRNLNEDLISDICYAFQESVLDVLVQKAHLAAKLKNLDTIVVGGGVAINSRLRDKFSERHAKVYFPNPEHCLDNAAMVGSIGEELYKRGHRSDLYLSAEPNLSLN